MDFILNVLEIRLSHVETHEILAIYIAVNELNLVDSLHFELVEPSKELFNFTVCIKRTINRTDFSFVYAFLSDIVNFSLNTLKCVDDLVDRLVAVFGCRQLGLNSLKNFN
jgi:hypothetical protein